MGPEWGVGSKKVVIVLSFFGTDYRYVHYTKSAGPLGFFFFFATHRSPRYDGHY